MTRLSVLLLLVGFLASAVPTQAEVVVPAGTTVVVRLIDSIDSNRTGPGERFRASVDDPIVVGTVVAVPRGADATVQVMTADANKSLGIKLYDITVDGKAYDVASEYAMIQAGGSGKTKKGAKRGIGLGALGAGVGAIAGGGKGAAIGAVSGVGLGALSGATSKGKHLYVPSESRLSFQLRAPVNLN